MRLNKWADTPVFYQYWGKARPTDSSPATHHLLPYHSLDVAAVGQVFLERHLALCTLLATRLGLNEATFTRWQTFFLALHDLGKFSHRFQGMLQKQPDAPRYTERHDSLGWLLWAEKLGDEIIAHPGFGATPNRAKRRIFELWAQTVTGHHGQPPKNFWGDKYIPALKGQFSPQDEEAARQFAAECAALLLPAAAPSLPDLKVLENALKPLSWWLAGIAVLSDWLGSNQDFFPYHTESMPLPQYWEECALPQAEKILQASGVIPLASKKHSLSELFNYLQPPTPLQNQAAEIALADGLFILEDVTGSGKTEAALMLAHRLIGAGLADGVYMALPTMATSNAMFGRIEEKSLHQAFFAGEPALLLAHSAGYMRQESPRQQILPEAPAESDYGKHEDSAATQRGTWLYDNRKKALLADFGVGTIDQALLAVLYSRHQALRLLGLSRKVLIVDEVHACDVYMQRLLEGVLEFQAAIGGSVILLSATLPQATRQCLADAYCKGLRQAAPELAENAYPLLTRVSAAATEEIPLDTRPEVARTVEVHLLHEAAEVHAKLMEIHQAGQCACWIRNTVGDALQALQDLQDAGIPAKCLELFHARFALGDRLEIEQRVLQGFGKDSGHADRKGRILVATQVVEQSLDLDFDLLVSDLAPMDLLIQRAGRLRRHSRDALGNRVASEQRGIPVFYVYGPAPVKEPEEQWYKAFFKGAAYVYEHHGQLWLTADVLAKTGAIVMPGQARELIEGVYGEAAQERIPAALQEKSLQNEGKQMSRRAIAGQNLVKLKDGYISPDFNFWDDASTPTRLGDASVTVRLGRMENGELRPWFAAEKFAWELSQVNVRESLIKDEVGGMEAQKENMPDKGRWSKLVVLRQDGGVWRGEAVNGKGEKVNVGYDKAAGLRVI
jgi:CRISPR-associated endonuclease/helicase Cas3